MSKDNNMKPIKVDAASFDSEVLESDLPVLVAFATLWSRPCKVLESVLEEIVSSCSEKLKVVWVNADENPDLGLWYDIHSVPTLLYFMAGDVRHRIIGTVIEGAILSKLEGLSSVSSKGGADADAFHRS